MFPMSVNIGMKKINKDKLHIQTPLDFAQVLSDLVLKKKIGF
jgi:hypothetical protein